MKRKTGLRKLVKSDRGKEKVLFNGFAVKRKLEAMSEVAPMEEKFGRGGMNQQIEIQLCGVEEN